MTSLHFNNNSDSFEDLTQDSLDILKAENKTLKANINHLEEQVIRLCQEFAPGPSELLDSLSRLSVKLRNQASVEKQNEELRHEVICLKRKVDDLEENRNEVSTQNCVLEKENEKLKVLNFRLRNEVKDLTERLSLELNNKISSNETSIENVNIRNSPMIIGEEYSLLCSQEWYEAKSCLDEQPGDTSEQDKLELLNTVIMECEEQAKEFCRKFKIRLYHLLEAPVLQQEPKIQVQNSEFNRVVPEKLYNMVFDHLRNTSDKTDMSAMKELVNEDLERKFSRWKNISDEHRINNFVSSSIKIAWKMVIQRPPMTYITPGLGDHFVKDAYIDIHWQSDDPSDPMCKVLCYCYPILCHDKAVIAKGKAYLKKIFL